MQTGQNNLKHSDRLSRVSRAVENNRVCDIKCSHIFLVAQTTKWSQTALDSHTPIHLYHFTRLYEIADQKAHRTVVASNTATAHQTKKEIILFCPMHHFHNKQRVYSLKSVIFRDEIWNTFYTTLPNIAQQRRTSISSACKCGILLRIARIQKCRY